MNEFTGGKVTSSDAKNLSRALIKLRGAKKMLKLSTDDFLDKPRQIEMVPGDQCMNLTDQDTRKKKSLLDQLTDQDTIETPPTTPGSKRARARHSFHGTHVQNNLDCFRRSWWASDPRVVYYSNSK